MGKMPAGVQTLDDFDTLMQQQGTNNAKIGGIK